MAQENVKVVRSAYAALAEEGVEALLAFTDPDFETTTPPSLASEPGTYRGHDGARRWFASFEGAMEGIYFEGTEFLTVGDKVVVDTTLHARGRTTGIAAEQRAFLLWTLRKGKLLRADAFVERDQALEAAGLSE